MLSDIIKAVIPVSIAMITFGKLYGMGQFGAAFTGLFAMLGHCFPVWYGFKGGKAVSNFAGFGIFLLPLGRLGFPPLAQAGLQRGQVLPRCCAWLTLLRWIR